MPYSSCKLSNVKFFLAFLTILIRDVKILHWVVEWRVETSSRVMRRSQSYIGRGNFTQLKEYKIRDVDAAKNILGIKIFVSWKKKTWRDIGHFKMAFYTLRVTWRANWSFIEETESPLWTELLNNIEKVVSALSLLTSFSLMESVQRCTPSRHWPTIGRTSCSVWADLRINVCKQKNVNWWQKLWLPTTP